MAANGRGNASSQRLHGLVPATTGAGALPATSVIGRTLRIIELLAGEFRLDLQSICHATALNKTTAHRLLADLVRAGLVVQDGRFGEYRLTTMLTSLSNRIDDRVLVLDAIAEGARRLTLRRTWPVAVGFLERSDVTVVFSTRHLTSLKLKPSTLYVNLPLTSAMGQAALATLPRSQLRSVFEVFKSSGATNAVISEVRSKAEAAKVRGYGLRITGRNGASSMAVGLNFGGSAVGAVVVTVFENIISKSLITSLVRELAELTAEASENYSKYKCLDGSV